MPLSGNAMSSAVRAAIASLSDEDKADHVELWNTICGAIVSHITANAVVNVTSVSGVTTGGGTSGPGTGTIS